MFFFWDRLLVILLHFNFSHCELKMNSKCHILEVKNRLNAGRNSLCCGTTIPYLWLYIMFSRKLVLSPTKQFL
jgi:hypothetical protein